MAIAIRKPWTTKPPPGTEIDFSNPLTEGLYFFCAMDQAGNQIDLVNHRPGIVVDNTKVKTRTASPYGLCGSIDGVLGTETAGWDFGNTGGVGIYEPSAAITIIARARVAGSASVSGSRIISKRSSAGGQDSYAIYLQGTAGTTMRYRIEQSDFATADQDIVRTAGNYFNVLVDVAVASDVVDQNQWIWEPETGAQQALLKTATFAGAIDRGNGNLCIGHRQAEVRTWDGDIHYVALFNTKKDITEIEKFRRNPWQIFKPQLILLPSVTLISITDVNTTESWTDGDTGLIITGTGFV